MKVLSFSKLEKSLLPKHRNRLSHAESVEDVKKFFFYSVKEFFSKSSKECQLADGDIELAPRRGTYFNVSPHMQNNVNFNELWQTSDMPVIIQRLAKSSVHRYQHLAANNLKSNLKIKGH